MATQTREYKRGSIRSQVRWMKERGASDKEVRDRVEEKFGRRHMSTANDELSYQNRMKAAARRVERASPTSNIDRFTLPNKGATREGTRVHVTFHFDKPDDDGRGRRVKMGMSFDFEEVGSKKEMMQAIRDRIVSWLMDHYRNRVADRGKMGRRLRDVKVEGLEGI